MNRQPNSIASKLAVLAARPDGVTTKDLPDLSSNSVGTAAWNMTNRGELHVIKSTRGNRWFTTKKARDSYAAKHRKPEQPGRKSFASPKLPDIVIRGRAWDKNAPPHFPKDEKGKPLYKITICPGFTGQPLRTNTFTGGY